MLNGKNGKQGSIQYDHTAAKMCIRKNGRRFIKNINGICTGLWGKGWHFPLCLNIKNSLL